MLTQPYLYLYNYTTVYTKVGFSSKKKKTKIFFKLVKTPGIVIIPGNREVDNMDFLFRRTGLESELPPSSHTRLNRISKERGTLLRIGLVWEFRPGNSVSRV